MEGYSNNLRIKDLIMNPKMENVLPQLTIGQLYSRRYSPLEIEEELKKYLKGVLNADDDGEGGLVVYMKYTQGVRKVKSLQNSLEAFFSNLPAIKMCIKGNLPIYTKFKSVNEILQKNNVTAKISVMKDLLENLKYNPQCGALCTKKSQITAQDKWKKKVGYRE